MPIVTLGNIMSDVQINVSFGAVEQLEIDPEVTQFLSGAMILMLVVSIGVIIWKIFESRKIEREEEFEARKHIDFDSKKCVLTRGSLRLEIPYDTLEYFVCKVVFEEPTQYHSDSTILEYARMDDEAERPVYQASRRINQKAKKDLELEDDLLKRAKLRTILNEKYI